MPRLIIKPTKGVDYYVVYSTIVDAPVLGGRWEDFDHDDPQFANERFARADLYGTSAAMPMGDGEIYRPFGWEHEEFQTGEYLPDAFHSDEFSEVSWWVKREDLQRFCETPREELTPGSGLLKFYPCEEEEEDDDE